MTFSYYGYEVIRESDLAHYGVLGMKWGVRRYQNPDGTLTKEGKRKARKEYKDDNKQAFQLGRDATITARALSKSNRKLDKHPLSPSEINVNRRLKSEYSNLESEAKKHRAQLVKKYGNMAVSNIKYDKYGRINERVVSGRDAAMSIIGTSGMLMVTSGLSLMGAPFIPFGYVRPKTAGERGREYYRYLKKIEKNNIKTV